MAVDPATRPVGADVQRPSFYATNPVDSDGGLWSFSRALDCMHGGGKVRKETDPLGYFIFIEGDQIFDSRGDEVTHLYAGDILACNWVMVSAIAPEGG